MRRVAVTGFGVVSPIGVGCAPFWDSIRAGRSGIDRITRFDCSTFSVQLAGEVKESLAELGLAPSRDTLVHELERAGLSRSSHDADDGIEVAAGF